ncbi:hypothetical protein EAI30_16860 [Romboutsia ilealis]|uniref:Uncharacterized protein n=1 Tax=Romboutsia faecis TaxID=2764597 RepID=A0ABR7JS59_9FIRM|nr:hypothetical protein [Romboutsia faecis]MBC5997744.1 hypothetical protein [Romboutsia faecis]MRN26282.1 hypothetical protein [Romboutsia ilealis]
MFFFVISFLIVISYIVTNDWPEMFAGADMWYNLASQIGIGYIINFIFYIMQVWMPEKKKHEFAKNIVKNKNSYVLKEMARSLSMIIDIDRIEEIKNSEDILTYIEGLDLQYGSGYDVYNNEINKLEFILMKIDKINQKISDIFTVAGPYLDAECLKCLDDIIESEYHEYFNDIDIHRFGQINCIQSPNVRARASIRIGNEQGLKKELSETVYKYVCLYTQLREINKKYTK